MTNSATRNGKTIVPLAIAAVLTLAVGLTSLSSSAIATPPADPETKSKAVTDDILDAVAAELERSKVKLRIGDAALPYFIGYKITEVEVNDVSASLGATTAEKDRHFVSIEAHVHAGDYKFDNSNFVAARREGLDGIFTVPLPLEATAKIAQRSAWIATDAAYKEALQQMSAKQEALRAGASGGMKDIPSYTKVEPAATTAPVLVPKLEDLESLKKRAESISRVFRDEAHIRDARVSFTSFLERRWLLNSEGASVHDTRRVSGVLITATSQATDGQELALYYTRYGLTAADLPSDDELRKEAKTLAKRLSELEKAPLVDTYTGPVLFEGQGAVGMVRYTLSRHLSGTPLPVGLSPRESKIFGGGLNDRIGLRVLSSLLSVVDDPTKSREGKRRLIGTYNIDDEGVPAKRVEVVHKGALKTLLMSRTPSAKLGKSNGHARLAMPGGVFRGSTTNLFVTSSKGVSRKALVKKLIKQVKAEGLPYGIIIRQFDDVAVTANPDLSRIELFQLLASSNPDAPPRTLLAYRVLPNGKQELVRGVQLDPVPIRAWRNIVASSRDRTIMNFLSATDDPALVRMGAGGEGFVPSAGVESAVVTPDLLFRELDIRRSTDGRRDAPLIKRPY